MRFLSKILMVILLISMGGMLFSCSNDISKVELLTKRDNLPIEITKEVRLTYSDSAVVKLRMWAGKLERYDGQQNKVELRGGVKVIFYNDTMGSETQLTAEEATHWEQDNKMEARNNVVVINALKERLETEHLIWEEEKQIIHTEEFVKITTAEEIIYGDGLEANQDFTKYKIKKIKGTLQVNEEDSSQTSEE